MKINKIQLTAFVLTLPAAGWAQPTAQKACESLRGQAEQILGSGQSFACHAKADGTLSVVASQGAFDLVRATAFPSDKFQQYAVVKDASGGALRQAAASADHSAYQLPPTPKSLAMPANFDGAVDYAGLTVLVSGPPGTMPPAPRAHPQSSSTRPPSPRPEGNDAPPPSSAPAPSRPTPVFTPRPPAPDYWGNVDWNNVTYWNFLPDAWESDHYDNSDADHGVFKSRWYPYGQTFVSGAGMTTDSESAKRNFDNQGDDIEIPLRSTQVTDVKTCYYRAIYNYHWSSREEAWKGEFQEYEPACIPSQVEGNSIDKAVSVQFDMGGASLEPWERETVVATFDGRNVGVRVDNPSYDYSEPFRRGDTFTFQAGAKRQTPPDVDGVSAVLINDNGALKVRVTDKWAAKYEGETLELAVKVVRAGAHFWSSDIDVVDLNWRDATQVDWSPVARSGAIDGGFDIPIADQGSGKYYVKSWAFRRVNKRDPNNKSRVSLDTPIYKSAGEYVTK